MVLKILAVALSWSGCLLPYLAARKQWLLSRSLPRGLSWTAFCILQLLAITALSAVYGVTIAALITLMLVMCSWSALVLAAGHMQGRPALLSALAVAVLSVIMVVG